MTWGRFIGGLAALALLVAGVVTYSEMGQTYNRRLTGPTATFVPERNEIIPAEETQRANNLATYQAQIAPRATEAPRAVVEGGTQARLAAAEVMRLSFVQTLARLVVSEDVAAVAVFVDDRDNTLQRAQAIRDAVAEYVQPLNAIQVLIADDADAIVDWTWAAGLGWSEDRG